MLIAFAVRRRRKKYVINPFGGWLDSQACQIVEQCANINYLTCWMFRVHSQPECSLTFTSHWKLSSLYATNRMKQRKSVVCALCQLRFLCKRSMPFYHRFDWMLIGSDAIANWRRSEPYGILLYIESIRYRVCGWKLWKICAKYATLLNGQFCW